MSFGKIDNHGIGGTLAENIIADVVIAIARPVCSVLRALGIR